MAAETPRGVVLADAAYGINTGFRYGLSQLRLQYVVGVQGSMTVWEPRKQPLPAKPRGQIGRPPRLLQRTPDHQPVSVRHLAMNMPSSAFREITWREGTDRKLRSCFAAVRVRVAHRDYEKAEPYAEKWLLIEWPRSEAEPVKYWVSTLPSDTPLKALVKMAKHRWIIERDYQELKQELGLGHFEGRNWRGFHHHATLCIAAYGFLVAERNRFPPQPAQVICDSPRPGQRRTPAHAGRRPERHNPTSIATLRIILARLLLQRLPFCPFCGFACGLILRIDICVDYARSGARMIRCCMPAIQQHHPAELLKHKTMPVRRQTQRLQATLAIAAVLITEHAKPSFTVTPKSVRTEQSGQSLICGIDRLLVRHSSPQQSIDLLHRLKLRPGNAH